MRFASIIKIAFRALRRNKLRSGLTALGIIIGVAAVIAVVGVGNGAKTQVEQQIASMGQNVIMIFAGNFSAGGVHSGMGGAGTLKLDDSAAMLREIPSIVAASPEVRSNAQVAAGDQNWFTNIQGESETYFDIRNWAFTEGTTFSDQDVRTAAKVAVIGQTVAKQIYGDTSPLGQPLRIKNVPFKVVGVLKGKGSNMFGQDQDDLVVIPYTSAMKRVSGGNSLRTINVQVDKAENLDKAQDDLTALLRQRHHVRNPNDDDFTIRNQQEFTDMVTSTSKVMTLLLVVIASVSLVVGGIGIMNIMLVSVTERTREIGIRMAVGAHGRDILLQFLIEAIALSCMGGIVGILLGFTAAQIVSNVAHWPVLVSTGSIVFSFAFSAAVGIFFGFYPAKKASELDPIEALRYE
ncbi:MAG: ABC transporter permease [Chthoniobacteraceae bacterium]